MTHPNPDPDYQALEALVVDNPDLQELEARLAQFNIFEALGAVRAELRHSDFLAFLLSPNQSHGLGDSFARLFIQKAIALSENRSLPITPIDFDLWDLDEMLVVREWQNMDILLVDEAHRFYCVIENKITTGEHSGQLQRYRQDAEAHYPGWKGLYIFLTPDQVEPSDPAYIPVDYNLINELLLYFIDRRASTMGPDVCTLLKHYSQMLRRHIVEQSELADLCRRIYRKHQRALDLIYEYRPDLQEKIRGLLETLIQENSAILILDQSTKLRIRFAVKAWDSPLLMEGKGWTSSGRILLFEFGNYTDRLGLYLIIGPGPVPQRQQLLDLAKAHHPPFVPAHAALRKSYNTILKRAILSPNSYEDAGMDELEPEIRKKWSQFLEHDLPALHQILQAQEWLGIGAE